MRQRLERLLADGALKLSFRPLFAGIEALETSAAAAIVRAAEELTGEPAGAVGFGTEGPVSYTHLDVYKRQLLIRES